MEKGDIFLPHIKIEKLTKKDKKLLAFLKDCGRKGAQKDFYVLLKRIFPPITFLPGITTAVTFIENHPQLEYLS